VHERVGLVFPFFLQFHIQSPDIHSHSFYFALVKMVVNQVHSASMAKCGDYAAIAWCDESWVNSKTREKYATGLRIFWPGMKVIREQACKLRLFIALSVEHAFKDFLDNGWEIEPNEQV